MSPDPEPAQDRSLRILCVVPYVPSFPSTGGLTHTYNMVRAAGRWRRLFW